MTYMAEIALVGEVLFREGSAAYPRVPDRNSTGFAQESFSRIPQQIREFSTSSAHDLIADYQQPITADFHQLFRFFSGWKKGEKQAEWRICGKGRFGKEDHKV